MTDDFDGNIFHRRRCEWNSRRILYYFNNIFKNVELLDGWKFIGCEYIPFRFKRIEEIKDNRLKTIRVHLQDKNKELKYDIKIPELVHDQFFFIGGFYKIPVFQLIDLPIIYRKDIIRLKTNTISISWNMDKINNRYNINIFSKKVPFSLLLTTYHTKEEFEKFIESYNNKNDIFNEIINQCNTYWDNTTQEERINELGKYFSTGISDHTKKGLAILFSIRVAYNVDFFSRRFMKTNSFLFELLDALHTGVKSDTNIKNKRVRFAEYILYPLIRSVYEMIVTLYSNRKIKFKVAQSIIVDDCNVSEIVHHSLAVNVITELESFLQLTLSGPSGFKKNRVPSYLRNIDDSYYGFICPADTPDRDGCGVILHLTPGCQLDENGLFREPDANNVTSHTISLTPFMEHDDQIRLQMASSQMRQAILLKNPEIPIIKSGREDNFLDYTTFYQKAKEDGVVLYVDYEFLVIKYSTEVITYKIGYRSLYLGSIDKLETKLVKGQHISKGDIIYYSKFLTESGSLTLGKNLLTGIMIYKGYNYEDGIILSEKAASDMTSLHVVEMPFDIESGEVLLSLDPNKYKPFPEIGSFVKVGDVCAKLKTLDGEDGFETINIEPKEIISNYDCQIVSIDIYPNEWCKQVVDFSNFIDDMIHKQTVRYNEMFESISSVMNPNDTKRYMSKLGLSLLDVENKSGKYYTKGIKNKGIRVVIRGLYESPIMVGDKVANRHGNKGVTAIVLPNDIMPRTEDGRVLDIIINPLGIPSRMNVGQLYEAHTAECIYFAKNKMRELYPDINSIRNYWKGLLDIIDNTIDKNTTMALMDIFDKSINNSDIGLDGFLNKLFILQPPFDSLKPKQLMDLFEYTGASERVAVFDPALNRTLGKVCVGPMYWMKLVHRAESKVAARSIGPYSKKTLQPLGGKANSGGHRLGEMEVWSLLAHGAYDTLNEMLTAYSDSPGLKNDVLSKILGNEHITPFSGADKKPQSLRLMEAYFKLLGLKLIYDDDNDTEKIDDKDDLFIE